MQNLHKFIQGGHYILLDVNSGAVHLVDKLIYEMIDHLSFPLVGVLPPELLEKLPGRSRQEIEECYRELYSLCRDNLLFSEDEYERFAQSGIDAPVKALCLHVAHDCNLRCRYCFADTGGFSGGRAVMDAQTGKKAVDFLVEHCGERTDLEIDFFGGEPLMAWDTVTAVVDYARKTGEQKGKRFSFTITTNGLLLDDEKIEYINREMSNVVLSLDGRQEINDEMRKTISGDGSYGIILPKFKKLIEGRNQSNRTEYYIRGTFTKNNLDFTEDVKAMYDAGFREISIEPVIVDESLPFAITANDIPRINEEYDKLYDIMKESGCDFNFFHFNIDLQQGPCVIKRLRGCGCGNEYVAVTPNGDIFPCHQFVGMEQWKMGNINNGEIEPDEKIKDYFIKTHIYSKDECKDCWARFYCSGGCNASSFIYCGDVRQPHKLSCELMKKRIECAVALSAERSVSGTNFCDNI